MRNELLLIFTVAFSILTLFSFFILFTKDMKKKMVKNLLLELFILRFPEKKIKLKELIVLFLLITHTCTYLSLFFE